MKQIRIIFDTNDDKIADRPNPDRETSMVQHGWPPAKPAHGVFWMLVCWFRTQTDIKQRYARIGIFCSWAPPTVAKCFSRLHHLR